MTHVSVSASSARNTTPPQHYAIQYCILERKKKLLTMVALSKTLCLGAGVSAVAVERVMFLRILVLIEKNAEQKNFRHSVHFIFHGPVPLPSFPFIISVIGELRSMW